ncbi:MAG: hypothetical protein R2797_09590 [Gelidibacter sp.]
MKNVCFALMALFAILVTSCEGDQGPPGADGGLIVSQAFEKIVQFTPGNNYEDFEPYGFEVFPTDVTLVYILWETIDGQDIWRLCPQNVFFENDVLIYNYDFTQQDVRFFLDGTVDFGTLDGSYTQNQVFRVVVVPADNVGRNAERIDYSDLNMVMDAYGITSFEKRN